MKVGKKVGVVLGTGGAKGFAHIGFLKTLEKNKIPIHRINGCSIGAVIAAAYASGMSAVEMERRALSIDWSKFFRKGFLIPFFGHVNRGRLKKFLESIFGNMKFSDTKIPLDIVTTELRPSLEFVTKVNNRGKIVPALMASISVPFFFKVIKFYNAKVFDGGVFDPLPVDIMQQETDVVIASTVHARHIVNKKDKILTVYTDARRLSWIDYSNVGRIIKLGELAARERVGEVRKVVLS